MVGLHKLYLEDGIPEEREDISINNQIKLNKQFYQNLHNGFIDFSLFHNDGKFLQNSYEEMLEAYKWDEPTKIYYHYAYLGEYIPKNGFNTRYSTAHYDFSQAEDLQQTLCALAYIIDHSEIEIKEAV